LPFGRSAHWRSARNTLDSFVNIGLGYLSLDRPAGTLSGGEAQRTKMIRHLSSALTDVTYVFDEPTIGLHPHDIQRMNKLLLALRDKGNTVLVVKHKPETIVIADHIVVLGPGAGAGAGAGTAGGTICFEGTVEGLLPSGTLTGRHFDGRSALKAVVRSARDSLPIRGATTNNLQNVNVDIPLGILVVITGVAGSGKSSLVHGSIPANTGVGVQCEVCEGKRVDSAVLANHFGGRDISEVLAMSVAEAEAFFSSPESKNAAAHTILARLVDVEQLLGFLDRLVDSGKSVIVIEHHQAVMAHADWIIDVGPGAGHDGGRIVFEGTPAALVAAGSTLTGEHLAAYVGLA
jgi:excinuclease UvrABC ATPase subunit